MKGCVWLLFAGLGATHEAFLSKYLDKNDAACRATWRSVLFAGKGTMPKAFDSDSALVDYVAPTSGAIGESARDLFTSIQKATEASPWLSQLQSLLSIRPLLWSPAIALHVHPSALR